MNATTGIVFALCVANAMAQSARGVSDTRPVTRSDAILVFESRAGTLRPCSYRLQVTRDGVVYGRDSIAPAFVPSQLRTFVCGNAAPMKAPPPATG